MNKVESALSRTTDTKALVIGTDTLPQVAEMFRKLFPDKRALVVADANTWRVAGDDVHKILAGAGVAQDEPYVFTDPKLYAYGVEHPMMAMETHTALFSPERIRPVSLAP